MFENTNLGQHFGIAVSGHVDRSNYRPWRQPRPESMWDLLEEVAGNNARCFEWRSFSACVRLLDAGPLVDHSTALVSSRARDKRSLVLAVASIAI